MVGEVRVGSFALSIVGNIQDGRLFPGTREDSTLPHKVVGGKEETTPLIA